MPVMTVVLIIVAALAGVVAVIAMVNESARRSALGRASGGSNEPIRSVLITPTAQSPLRERLLAMFPASDGPSETKERLIHAGYDGMAAVPIYAAIRLVTLAGFVLLGVTFAPRHIFLQWILMVVFAAVLGALIPLYWVTHAVNTR